MGEEISLETKGARRYAQSEREEPDGEEKSRDRKNECGGVALEILFTVSVYLSRFAELHQAWPKRFALRFPHTSRLTACTCPKWLGVE